MRRKARIDMAGAVHHLIIRGIERGRIFREDQDRNSFLGRLGKILAETKTPCYAWALLPNHCIAPNQAYEDWELEVERRI